MDDELELTDPEHPNAKEAAGSTARLLVHLHQERERKHPSTTRGHYTRRPGMALARTDSYRQADCWFSERQRASVRFPALK